MEKLSKQFLKIPLLCFIFLVVLSLIFSIEFSVIHSFRIVFGSFYVLFLPGFFLTWIFFTRKELDSIERVFLSFALSIAIVPLVTFYLNLAGIKINAVNIFFIVAFLIAVCIIFIRKLKYSRS